MVHLKASDERPVGLLVHQVLAHLLEESGPVPERLDLFLQVVDALGRVVAVGVVRAKHDRLVVVVGVLLVVRGSGCGVVWLGRGVVWLGCRGVVRLRGGVNGLVDVRSWGMIRSWGRVIRSWGWVIRSRSGAVRCRCRVIRSRGRVIRSLRAGVTRE